MTDNFFFILQNSHDKTFKMMYLYILGVCIFMAIRVVEFSNGGYKIRKILSKNQQSTYSKEIGLMGASEVFKNQSFKNLFFKLSHSPN